MGRTQKTQAEHANFTEWCQVTLGIEPTDFLLWSGIAKLTLQHNVAHRIQRLNYLKCPGDVPVRWHYLCCSESESSPALGCVRDCRWSHPVVAWSAPCGSVSPGWSPLRPAGEPAAGRVAEAVPAQPPAEATWWAGQGGPPVAVGISYLRVVAVGAAVGRCWPRWSGGGPSARTRCGPPSLGASVCPAGPLWPLLRCECEAHYQQPPTPGSWKYLNRQEEVFFFFF